MTSAPITWYALFDNDKYRKIKERFGEQNIDSVDRDYDKDSNLLDGTQYKPKVAQ